MQLNTQESVRRSPENYREDREETSKSAQQKPHVVLRENAKEMPLNNTRDAKEDPIIFPQKREEEALSIAEEEWGTSTTKEWL